MLKTTMKIAAVTERTSRDSRKISSAGVDAGAKMFVGLHREVACAAQAGSVAARIKIDLSAVRMLSFREEVRRFGAALVFCAALESRSSSLHQASR